MNPSARRSRPLLVGVLLVAASGAGAAGESAQSLRLPADVTYRSAEASPGPVVFSHAIHVPLAHTRCVTCHPAAFSILRPTGALTHEDMNAGRRCGICHDGRAASGVEDDCMHCHRTAEDP